MVRVSASAARRPKAFRAAILRWFASHGRDLPWRGNRLPRGKANGPWAVLVSELMLQQTQVSRVIPKFTAFIRRWPTPAAFASVSLGEALAAWSGLGYNRRARFLREAAIAVTQRHGGVLPRTVEELEALPGIGRYTSRAVAAFAYGADVVLWDTNVRRIALRYFYGGEFSAREVGADELERALAAALPAGRSSDWHGALMDFGSAVCVSRAPLCASCPLRRSCLAAPRFLNGERPARALNKKQSRFEGSRRQVRGLVLRLLAEAGPQGMPEEVLYGLLRARLRREDGPDVVAALIKEGMVAKNSRKMVSLPS